MESILVFGSYFLFCLYHTQKSNTNDLVDDNERKKQKRRVIILLAVVTILLGALRSPYTGIDTQNYIKAFSIWHVGTPVSTYWEIALNDFASEQGYYILERLFYAICPNVHLWMAFLCTLFIVPCSILIYRYSDNPAISFIYLVALFIYTFTWQGLRQNVAMSICLFAFLLLFSEKGKKFLRVIGFILLVLFAFQFHRSSLIFLLVLPAMLFKVRWFDFIWIGVVFVVTILFPSFVNTILMDYLNLYDKVDVYASGEASHATYTMFFVLLAIYIGCFLLKDELIEKNPINKTLFKLSMIGIMIQAMAVVIAELFRVSYYFSIFNMLLVANAAQLASEKYSKLWVRAMVVAVMALIFFVAGGFDYWFFWQTR